MTSHRPISIIFDIFKCEELSVAISTRKNRKKQILTTNDRIRSIYTVHEKVGIFNLDGKFEQLSLSLVGANPIKYKLDLPCCSLNSVFIRKVQNLNI